ncbi:MAG: T9SS type A sorting domain-containing protein [Saprospiraceae bacterium]
MRIYSSTGQMVRHEKVTGKNWQGNIAELNPGLYILTVANEKGLIFRNKISKL